MLAYGLKVAFLGMGIVFIGLFLLMLIIKFQSKFFVQKSPQSATSPVEKVPETAHPSNTQEDNELDDETVAVIAAVIQAVYGTQIIVKNIKRITGSQGLPWAQMGRVDAMNLRKL
ncbi:MAG: OadG family protein [Clostridia bacterium]|nr:OadG family protein [Clostridia bacterium]